VEASESARASPNRGDAARPQTLPDLYDPTGSKPIVEDGCEFGPEGKQGSLDTERSKEVER